MEKENMQITQRALLNILEDFGEEKINLQNTQRAVLNILEDFGEERINMQSTQSAILNILDDYAEEKRKVESTNKNLASVNKELEQFIYSASHDLQEPIRMVIIYLQLIQKKYKDKLDNEANDFINFAMEGSNRMRSLILSLLDYSNVNIELPFETIEVNELLNAVLKDLSNQIKDSNAVITVEPLPVIFGNNVLIRQLFQNLISNAIKFKGERNPEIVISGKKNNDEFLFSIKDNGIGIQKEYAEKLFTIFQRLNTREQYPGTGIGLVICKKIVEKHGGKIWFESEFGRGATFYFTIKEKIRKSNG
jgi:light-regulated signal transduction histidine kinase (bacteriophytochrome)